MPRGGRHEVKKKFLEKRLKIFQGILKIIDNNYEKDTIFTTEKCLTITAKLTK